MTVNSRRAPDVRRMWPASSPRYRVLNGHQHATGGVDAERRDDPSALFGAQTADPIARLDACGDERLGYRVSLGLQLSERQPGVAVHHCLVVCETVCGILQGSRDRERRSHPYKVINPCGRASGRGP